MVSKQVCFRKDPGTVFLQLPHPDIPVAYPAVVAMVLQADMTTFRHAVMWCFSPFAIVFKLEPFRRPKLVFNYFFAIQPEIIFTLVTIE